MSWRGLDLVVAFAVGCLVGIAIASPTLVVRVPPRLVRVEPDEETP